MYRDIKKLKAGTMYSNVLSPVAVSERIKEIEDRIASYKSDLWYNLYTDVSDDVAKVIEHELDGKYVGDGWKDFKYNNR